MKPSVIYELFAIYAAPSIAILAAGAYYLLRFLRRRTERERAARELRFELEMFEPEDLLRYARRRDGEEAHE